MRRIVIVAAAVMIAFGVLVARAQTRTHSWSAVTTYTDNTPIEAGNSVTYSAWRQDSVTSAIVRTADHISATSYAFDDAVLAKGRTYNFWVQAHLSTGASSDNSAIYAWVNPTGKAAAPAGQDVQ